MPSQTNEQALESAIEKHLTGSSLEELKAKQLTNADAQDTPSVFRSGKGYFMGFAQDFNAKYAIDETRFWDFLEKTQKMNSPNSKNKAIGNSKYWNA